MTRELPNSLKIEQSLLGSLMIYPNVMNDCQDLDLSPDEFFTPSHQRIFQCMKEIKDNGQPLDINTIVTRLQDKDELEAAGGADYIVRLADSAISSANARHYIETIKNKAQLRALIYAADKIAQEGYESPEDIDTILDDAERSIMDVTRQRRGAEFESSQEIVNRVIEELKALKSKQGITGIQTGDCQSFY